MDGVIIMVIIFIKNELKILIDKLFLDLKNRI